jgi:hypothetical protein
MSRTLEALAARKQLLVAQSELLRMQLALYAGDARDALRPAGVVGGAIARPAAAIAMIDTVARLFRLHRLSRLVRIAGLALMAFRFARAWRGSQR